MRRVDAEVVDQRLGESLHREFRGAVGGVRLAHVGGPEAVDAGDVDDVTFVRLQQKRQKGAYAEIDAAPADVEGALPLRSRVGDHAAAAADASIVEQQMDLVCLLLVD